MGVPERLKFKRASDDEVREFCALCDEIERSVIDGEDVSVMLERWNRRANREFDAREFTTYSGAMSTAEFVRDALSPAVQLVPDLTYAEARAVLECVMNATLDGAAEHNHYLRWLTAQFQGTAVSDLIYWPDQFFGVRAAFQFDFSADQLLWAAMEHSGRMLPGAPPVTIPFKVPSKTSG